MPNRAIEFHDSTFDSLERDGANVTLRFSEAYIHESNGEPGMAAGSGWVQEVRIHIGGASLSGEIPELPCDLWDGNIRLGGDLFQMVPIPLDYKGTVEINLEQKGKIRVVGTSLRLELIGKPKYVEEFPGHR
jgi:hypothetical protein